MEVIALTRLMPKPSRRVANAITIAARSERPKEIPNAERCVALMKRPPVLHRIAAPSTSSKGETCALLFSDWIGLTKIGTLIHGFVLLGLFTVRPSHFTRGLLLFERLQELSKLSIPRRNHYGHGTVGFRLTSEPDQRLRLGRIDVAELFDLLPFAGCHIGEFFRTANHTN